VSKATDSRMENTASHKGAESEKATLAGRARNTACTGLGRRQGAALARQALLPRQPDLPRRAPGIMRGRVQYLDCVSEYRTWLQKTRLLAWALCVKIFQLSPTFLTSPTPFTAGSSSSFPAGARHRSVPGGAVTGTAVNRAYHRCRGAG